MKEIMRLATYEDYKQEFDRQFLRRVDAEVAIGYLLKLARDTDILRSSGYTTMSAFAQKEYGIKPDKASLYIGIQERFADPEKPNELAPEYVAYGSSKLAALLALPDETIKLLDPSMKREEIRDVVREIKEEQKITDLEVLMEEKPEGELSTLQQAMEIYLAEHQEKLKKLLPALGSIEEAAEVLVPNGITVLMPRVPGKGKMMISIRDIKEPVELQNVRTLETETYEWPEFLQELQELYRAVRMMEPEAAVAALYGEPEKEPEEKEPEPKKPEPWKPKSMKRETAPEKVPEEKEEIAPAKKEEPEESQTEEIPGQDNIMNHPEYLPAGMKEEKPQAAGPVDIPAKIGGEAVTAEVELTDKQKKEECMTLVSCIQGNIEIENYTAALKHTKKLLGYLEVLTC